MKESTAWILSLATDLQAGVGELEMVHLVPSPELFDVPATPFYCRHVLIWEDGILPVLDLAAWLKGHAEPREHRLVGIFAYQDRPGATPRHGGLLLERTPRRVQVSDKQASGLPEDSASWRQIAVSCFTDDEGKRIPIIDLAQLFSRALLTD